MTSEITKNEVTQDYCLKMLNEADKYLNKAAEAAEDASAFTLYCAIRQVREVCEDFKERRQRAIERDRQ
jgi:hypothetical protein